MKNLSKVNSITPYLFSFPLLMLITLACSTNLPLAPTPIPSGLVAPTPDIKETDARIHATLAALPTSTGVPTPAPTLTLHEIPSPTSTPAPTAVPTNTNEPTETSRSLYTDGEVDKFIQQFPSLADPYDNRSPDNVLQILKIDPAVLEETDRYVGDCLCFIAYKLSPNYELVVDNNACSGLDIFVRKRKPPI